VRLHPEHVCEPDEGFGERDVDGVGDLFIFDARLILTRREVRYLRVRFATAQVVHLKLRKRARKSRGKPRPRRVLQICVNFVVPG